MGVICINIFALLLWFFFPLITKLQSKEGMRTWEVGVWKVKIPVTEVVESKSIQIATINIKKQTQLASIWREGNLRRILEKSYLKERS